MAPEASSTRVNGIDLSYASVGDHRSTFGVVFLPGPTDSWLSYEPILELLPEGLRAVAVSQRGHGDSAKPSHGYGIEDFASDAAALVGALGLDRAVLVGHSGSCLTARRVAIDHPDVVAGLILEASPLTLQGDAGLAGFVDTVVSALEDPIGIDFARSFVVDTSSADVSPGEVERFAAELLKVPARVWREMFAGLLAYDDAADLSRIDAPVLLVWGDGDGLVGRAAQDELVRRLPRATLTTYAGAGHAPRWEEPERFAVDVAAFAEAMRGSLAD